MVVVVVQPLAEGHQRQQLRVGRLIVAVRLLAVHVPDGINRSGQQYVDHGVDQRSDDADLPTPAKLPADERQGGDAETQTQPRPVEEPAVEPIGGHITGVLTNVCHCGSSLVQPDVVKLYSPETQQLGAVGIARSVSELMVLAVYCCPFARFLPGHYPAAGTEREGHDGAEEQPFVGHAAVKVDGGGNECDHRNGYEQDQNLGYGKPMQGFAFRERCPTCQGALKKR